MIRRRRFHARLLSEYLDARLSDARPESPPDDVHQPAASGFDANLDLARELAELDLQLPHGLAPRLAERLRRLPPEDAARPWWSRWVQAPFLASNRFLFRAPGWLTASVGLVVAAVALIVLGESSFGRLTTASAEEVLRLNDAGLDRLAQPGQWLYRRWRVESSDPSHPLLSPPQQIVSEWADGDDPAMVAGEGRRSDGRLLWRYVTVPEAGGYRPHVYFTADYPGPERGTLYLRPTDAEIAAAFGALPAAQREALDSDLRYLTADFYVPIVSDRRFNLWALEVRARPRSLFGGIELGMDQAPGGSGRQVYRVRMIRPLALAFRWPAEGVSVRVGRSEVVKEISADRYITLRATVHTTFPDGSQTFLSHTREALRAVPARAGRDDPFELAVPPNTPVHRHLASETLQAIIRALASQGRLTAAPEVQVNPAR